MDDIERENGGPKWWIGGYDEMVEGDYIWESTQHTICYANWDTSVGKIHVQSRKFRRGNLLAINVFLSVTKGRWKIPSGSFDLILVINAIHRGSYENYDYFSHQRISQRAVRTLMRVQLLLKGGGGGSLQYFSGNL